METVVIDVPELVRRFRELRPDIYLATICALERLVIASEEAVQARVDLADYFAKSAMVPSRN